MNTDKRIRYLQVALITFGAIFIFGILPLSIVWPSGWSWHDSGRSYYLEMIIAFYATLGFFLIVAAKNPLANLSLIWFTVWSSVAHALVMAIQSFDGEHNMGHLFGDVPALLLAALVLGILTPRQSAAVSQAPQENINKSSDGMRWA